ncbi:MAG: cysteine--tRNA ligase [Proteobacteria bacterium]|nr:MAG: cysteine--tRNA ligase [Pseudomonadota bacterium]
MLKIYNSLTNKKETFKPLTEGKIKIYVCGMTVYDYCHLGHARVLVAFDVIYRYLVARGYDVTYVRNITDIDDKIIARANEKGEEFLALTERFIDAMHEDERALNVLPPTYEPKATENIPEIIAMIRTLVEKGHAYQGSNGDVYYDVSSFPEYGKLSSRKVDDLRAGERIAVEESKNDPLDFVLWKMAKPNEPFWESPWGDGRPGWHIECSAMSTKILGNHFDIHGGGHDLQFPHHENEIAQSEACTGERFANYWMHNGFVRINDEKMSKSLGNFFTIRDVLENYPPEAMRYFLLSSNYRSPLNYSSESLDGAIAGLDRLYNALRGLPPAEATADTAYEDKFYAAMDDDFNTAEALATLFDLARDLNKTRQTDSADAAAPLGALLKKLAAILGLLQLNPDEWLQRNSSDDGLDVADIEAKIQERIQAKANKDWAKADAIRDALKAAGITLEDKGAETIWRRG